MNPTWFTQRKALLLVLIACILLAVIIVKTRPSMQHEPREGFISSVNFINVQQYSVKPAITGFGVVKPDILFEAKSEVSGKIIFLHPQ